jgi:hypothetical protein
VPEELHRIMRQHPEIKWGEIARRALWDYARKLELMNRIAEKSQLTEKDVEEIASLVRAGLSKRYGELAATEGAKP